MERTRTIEKIPVIVEAALKVADRTSKQLGTGDRESDIKALEAIHRAFEAAGAGVAFLALVHDTIAEPGAPSRFSGIPQE